MCYWDVYSIEGKECSYVIVPSDIYGKNRKIYSPTGKTLITESFKGEVNNLITEQELKELQEKLDVALTENQDLKAQVATLTEENDTLKTENQTLKESNESLTTENQSNLEKLNSTTTLLNEAETKIESEKAMRATLEEQLSKEKLGGKKILVETVVNLRKVCNKPEIAAEILESRSTESLLDALSDLKEEMSRMEHINGRILNPTLGENDDSGKNVNKDKKPSNINLEEALKKIF